MQTLVGSPWEAIFPPRRPAFLMETDVALLGLSNAKWWIISEDLELLGELRSR